MEPRKRFDKLLAKCKDDPAYVYEGVLLDIAEKISVLMAAQNMTRSELAISLACSSSYITKLLRCSGNPTLKTLFRVSNALGSRLSVYMTTRTARQGKC